MIKKIAIYILLPGVFIFLLVSDVLLAKETIQWHFYFSPVPGTSYDSIACKVLPKKIEEVTNGGIKVISCPDIVKRPESLEALRTRRIEIGWWSPTSFDATIPGIAINSVPGLWDSPEQLNGTLRKLDWLKEVNELTKKYNCISFAFSYNCPHVYFSNRPLDKVETFKNIKLRTAGGSSVQIAKELGAKPVSIAWGEVYIAAKTKVIDAIWTGSSSGYGISIHEVMKNVSVWPCYIHTPLYVLGINKAAWENISQDHKLKLMKAFEEIENEHVKGVLKEEQEAFEIFKQNQCSVAVYNDKSELAKWKPIIKRVSDEWVNRAEKAGHRFSQGLAGYFRERGFTVQ